ncbi:PREDICTED: alpha carbonic anhydrase 7-like [Nelumbo nucifera]|uniref:Carbonic anhydrase n=2 Tax=Nelumbo nucifera TaxID=4432 RepID=A0A822Z4U0_NELNU|nr:PREDICTED: alpha carbonic anhydrase 7-like [Nelumbo nucifera]DAD39573.1 TPA_asm: hypothetical protein HUJ06_013896 [Nelumbo nucifera]
MEPIKPIFLAILLVIPSLLFSPVTTEEVEDEREFNYVEGSGVGPEHWGEIHEEWAACGNGEMQSPIDLSEKKVEVLHHLGKLKRRYRPSRAVLVNRGHDIMIKWVERAGSIYINGTRYFLRHCHWHSPSEHTINGVRYALEGHMVHESSDKKVAVVGILYKFGRPDRFLSMMENYVFKTADKEGAEEELGIVNPKRIKLGGTEYYRYMGSLTTPPCTEGVVWTILKKVKTVSKEQVELLRMAVHDDSEMNARPTQPTNYRSVHYYKSRRL